MTEKQKMLLGIIYNADDDYLRVERNQAKEILYDYNHTRPSQVEMDGKPLIRRLFGQCGERFDIEQPLSCDYGYRIAIGEDFFANTNLTMIDGGGITIGSHVFMGCNVGIYTAQHPLDVRRRDRGYEWAMPVTIGDHVWIGSDVTILPGVTIGSGVTIGAGSVVTKDIPDNCVAVGNPCKVTKKIIDKVRQ